MKMFRDYILLMLAVLSSTAVEGQIVIGGSVYGGARQADVKGSTFVDIGADNHDILINAVYGGNDISGTVGTGTAVPAAMDEATANGIDNTYNAFVRISPEKTVTTTVEGKAATRQLHHIFMGSLFGGGNGEGYDYTTPGSPYYGMTIPELDKSYLEVKGGTIAYIYGGGNNATVKVATDICIDNHSEVTTAIPTGASGTTNLLLDKSRLQQMGIAILEDVILRDVYHHSRVFGGNNKADMAIRPTWHLKKGNIENLDSGGNEGRMTSQEGLVLQIDEGSDIMVHNVYGGCRKADVRPLYASGPNKGKDVQNADIRLNPNPNKIPSGFAARTRVLGGNITNVYGGNDISGNVYGGNTVSIFTTIHGDVYGGGNGSYAYTDNAALAGDLYWGDYYYNPDDVLAKANLTATSERMKSAEALNAFRPNAEQVSILLKGTAEKPVFIEGSVYVGGNSASLHTLTANAHLAEIKIGSYVTADKVFLGNNGENMVDITDGGMLAKYAGNVRNISGTEVDFSSLDLTQSDLFDKYMEGCAMKLIPGVVFQSKASGDVDDYVQYSTKFGSFYFGGNVGSMMTDGLTDIHLSEDAVIYNKVVGGCNKANVEATRYNAAYFGGLLGSPDSHGDKLKITFDGLKIQPMRWKDPNDLTQGLVWNTYIGDTPVDAPTTLPDGGTSTADDKNRRLRGGNVYGGCYESGHVNGNVIINLNESLVDREGTFAIFDTVDQSDGEAKLYENDSYKITARRSGVILDEQGMDVLGSALNVFGGGYGKDSEIWGSTTVNLNAGYTFQIFGGGEQGAVGHEKDSDGNYIADERYSTYINLTGGSIGVARGATGDNADMAEAEFIYGGGFEGLVAGSTHVNLGNGRIFNAFAGACNADILGHTETYVGQWTDKSGSTKTGYPWIRDHIYGGNDLGGQILGSADFTDHVREDVAGVKRSIHGYNAAAGKSPVTTAAAYTEYRQGHVGYIFGGCYGDYDYTDREYEKYTYDNGLNKPGFTKPRLGNAFVNFRPNANADNAVARIHGAGQGHLRGIGVDSLQNSSYILIDIPQGQESNFQAMEVFGTGAYSGIGMGADSATVAAAPDRYSAIIDLFRGNIANVYGGSFQEGFTRRAIVNVPAISTITVQNLFGGAFGLDPMYPCDVYEAQVNYRGENATVKNNIYGGNNNADRTLYGQVNIYCPVWQNKASGYLARVFGAGYGQDTWSQYTEVNLENGARVYEVYGGGHNGKVLNTPSLLKWLQNDPTLNLSMPGYEECGIAHQALVHATALGGKYNTNVHIKRGATVVNYAYGGGLGDDKIPGSGDVRGTTYIDLLGGTVMKDIYAAGTTGGVNDSLRVTADGFAFAGDFPVAAYRGRSVNGFTASATAYIEGGTARNVYGGGWKGDVGVHDTTTVTTDKDILGETHVVIGIRPDQSSVPAGYGFYKGVPAVQRNAYGGGEGGAVFGKSHLTLNNGYVGYEYANEAYNEKIDDDTYYVENVYAGDGRLKDCGNLFGGGYDVRSSVDSTEVVIWNGLVRNSVHGGGEIATVGRGATKEDGATRTLQGIYKAGATHVEMYNGHVLRNVFGGGKGYNQWGYGQQNTLYTDGYVFGKTEVYIHGGEIGTAEGLASGYGNVFGAGDIGYVYSRGYFADKSRKTVTGSPGHYYYYDFDGRLTEDCKVVVAPQLQVLPGRSVTFNGKTYNAYDYVPTDYLNTLPKKNADGNWGGGWIDLDTGTDAAERGVTIRNAVFAGGNVSSNSDKTYANATTVFGNTTATIYDVYHRDFITVGTEHTGGVYGGGNLSVVGGYRELNITNYGTDYYGLSSRITLDEYRSLSNRERAYFQLEYVCTGNTETGASGKKGITIGGEFYEENQRLTEEKYLKLIEAYPSASTYWEPFGFCSIYAGRLLNTIQRADLCGVYGSRMVLQGAKDRVADVAENIDYTINRVGELSLNAQYSVAGDTGDEAEHGNYFGIYSLVNYLGNLTSDVSFGSTYVDGSGTTSTGGTTYYNYKAGNPTSSTRNKGKSYNQVALASGVFLELTTEETETRPNKEKVYGLITGVIELDLINVKQDQVGGGFVYAKNEHRVPMYYPNKSNVILSEYNHASGGIRDEAYTYKRYRYSPDQDGDWSETTGSYTVGNDDSHRYQSMVYQTSGNFIHPTKRIVDDCYPVNNAYKLNADPYSEAHYWYVKGEVYIYDQKVSAYTGSATAYSKAVNLPLTITAASHGKLQLLDVKPNLYAYYATVDKTKKIGDLDADGNPIEKVMVNNESESYELNDVITWWDWSQLSASEKRYFVAETYVNCVEVTVDGKTYAPGTYVMDDADFTKFQGASHTVVKASGDRVDDLTEVFRSSNNISHDTGYVLTFDMNSPSVWDDYYISTKSTDKITKAQYEALMAAATTDAAKQAVIDDWREGPTFTPETTGVYGQRQYSVGEIVTKEIYDNYKQGSGEQATVEKAYVSTREVSYTYNGTPRTINPGTAIPASEYNAIGATAQGAFASAWVCTATVKLTDENYVLNGDLLTDADIAAIKADYAEVSSELDQSITPAYICSKAGGYGGQEFRAGTNYSAIAGWCALPAADRGNFQFNYDALDLLNDTYPSPYSDEVNVEYQAVYNGDTPLTYAGGTLTKGHAISNEEFETSIRNDRRHYTRVPVKAGGETVYIANENFIYGGTPYGKAQLVDAEIYNNNSSRVEAVDFSSSVATVKYYCYEDYDNVTKGTVISESEYAGLTNDQQKFIIQGKEPTETTTLYVSRESDIYDLSKERIYTVVYQYTYYEDEDDGSVKLTNELHVINVHLQLESGVPQIGTLVPPATVLPGSAVGLKAPEVTPGLYEVLTNGWELFSNSDDADQHRNGVPFTNNNDPLYWYQNGKTYVAFYSKTYLGKTYSNAVPLSVANYHDLDAVMKDKEHHLYIDKSTVDRPSKIYIDNRDCESDAGKSELDLLKDLFDLSLQTGKASSGETAGHAPLDTYVRGARNLEFILNSDVSPKKYTDWTPIGGSATAPACFSGTLHGDGHTVSGLNHSLFASLCGNVYNLGVTGSFTSAGVADTGDGFVENSWVMSSATTMDADVSAVFGKPTAGSSVKQVVNCYYPETNPYATSDPGSHGLATKMPLKAFYDGEVAYNLNGFYLNKRYYDNNTSASGAKPYTYQYYEEGTAQDGTTALTLKSGKYGDDYWRYVYVEDRYADGDFRYAGGAIPSSRDVRQTTKIVVDDDGEENEVPVFYPIWPDDYLFFGQTLTYGYSDSRQHQDTPSSIMKIDGRLPHASTTNRVYRAPAYFGSKEMGVTHFNPDAVFAQSRKDDPNTVAYKGMTAIDFTGSNGDVDGGYVAGLAPAKGNRPANCFFPPLLDDGGLTGFLNADLTANLLVYIPQPTTEAATSTSQAVTNYLQEPDYADYQSTAEDDPESKYLTVARNSTYTIRGHWVEKDAQGSGFTATVDHLLVDKEDFNAPISYRFADDERMWYQRTPDRYVDLTEGWEDISLPFTADLVSTQQKGELTHFFSGSTTGHEYWLRGLEGVGAPNASGVALADMNYPAVSNADADKRVTNTFLWDYYYQATAGHNQLDKNADTYQTYYSTPRDYAHYPRLTAAVPYIIGFPGSTYYEFDLSGTWTAGTTAVPTPNRITKQVITFASAPAETIGVTDDLAVGVSKDGFTFHRNFANQTFAAGTANTYTLSADGSSYDKVQTAEVKVSAFRPYITGSANSARTRGVGQIVFGKGDSFGIEDRDASKGVGGSLNAYAQRKKIVVESDLKYAVDVRIVNVAGITLNSFTIEPGEIVETRVNISGVYIVETTDSRFTKKLAVK